MELTTDEVRTKKLIKEALIELVQERQKLFFELIVESIEEIGLVEAIREGRKNEFVPDIVTAEYRTSSRTAENARKKLIYQLADLWIVEGYTGHILQELAGGSFDLIVTINRKQAIFVYDVSGNDPLITRIILRDSRGNDLIVPNPGLFNSYTLPETIQKLIERYSPKTSAEMGKTPEQVIDGWVEYKVIETSNDPLLQLAGEFESPYTDIAENHDSYIGEAVKSNGK